MANQSPPNLMNVSHDYRGIDKTTKNAWALSPRAFTLSHHSQATHPSVMKIKIRLWTYNIMLQILLRWYYEITPTNPTNFSRSDSQLELLVSTDPVEFVVENKSHETIHHRDTTSEQTVRPTTLKKQENTLISIATRIHFRHATWLMCIYLRIGWTIEKLD